MITRYRIITFIVHLTAVLDHTSLAVSLLLRSAGVAGGIGTGIASVGITVDVHVLETHGEERYAVVGSAGRGRNCGGSIVVADIVRIAGSLVRGTHGSGTSGGRRHCGPEGRGAALQSRLDRRVGPRLLTRRRVTTLVGQLTSVTGGHRSSGDTPETCVMVVEVLLSVIVRATTKILSGSSLVGGLGRRGDDVVSRRRKD